MKKQDKQLLKLFQCDFNRSIEENFAQVFCEKESVRLFFINENQAFTDGQNIVVDPAVSGVFADTQALHQTEDFMHINHAISTDPWNALRLITRGQNIHECLHILYSNFPPEAAKDPRATTKARRLTLASIANIIEDAFIEAVGCSIFDNLELFLQFHRLSTLFSNTPTQGTVDRAFEGQQGSQKEPLALIQYLNYMLLFLLYPMVQLHPPGDNFSAYVEQTKQLFVDGAVCGNAVERFAYAQQIFDIIQPLIPLSELEIQDDRFNKLLFGSKTHNGEVISIATITSKGRSAQITRRLFTDLEGKPLPEKDFNQQLIAVTKKYADEKAAVTSIVLFEPVVTKWNGTQFDCHNIHNGIEIIETKPKPNLSLRKAYQNIYSKYRININSYNSRFTQLLKARVPSREEHKLFGSGISSRHLADTKKRYWYRKDEEFGIPDVAVMLLIDGSGSMSGARREEAMVSCVILHEVLKKQGISHAIVEHRAIYGMPVVKHEILVDFNGRNEEKYNILALDAKEGTREGLSLYWAEKYINSKTSESDRLIIVLSDGVPMHAADDDSSYEPPVSTKDTANAALKIIKRGTGIIAVALNTAGEYSCYDDLCSIYPSVIACPDLKRLTGQLLGIISKFLR